MSFGGGGVNLLSDVATSHCPGGEVWVTDRAGQGGVEEVGGRGVTVGRFNPHVFDSPTMCEGMCLLWLLFTHQVGSSINSGHVSRKNGNDQKSIIMKIRWLLSLQEINFYYLCMWTFWVKFCSFVAAFFFCHVRNSMGHDCTKQYSCFQMLEKLLSHYCLS